MVPELAAEVPEARASSSNVDAAAAGSSGIGEPNPRARPKAVELIFECEGGRLVYYESNQNFAAICENPAHGRCVFTRSSTGSKSAARSGQGRPIGKLVAWLFSNDQASKADHRAYEPSLDERVRLRTMYRANETFRNLETHERGQVDGEDSEPEVVP